MAQAVLLAMIGEVGIPGSNSTSSGNKGPDGREYQIWHERCRIAGVQTLSYLEVAARGRASQTRRADAKKKKQSGPAVTKRLSDVLVSPRSILKTGLGPMTRR